MVVGEEVKLLPYEQIGEKIDQKIESQVGAVENRLQGEIENLPSGGSGGSTYTPPFKIEILNTDLSFPDGGLPVPGVRPTVEIYVEGAGSQGRGEVNLSIGTSAYTPRLVSNGGTPTALVNGRQTLSFFFRSLPTGLADEIAANGYAALRVYKEDDEGTTVNSDELYLPILSAPPTPFKLTLQSTTFSVVGGEIPAAVPDSASQAARDAASFEVRFDAEGVAQDEQENLDFVLTIDAIEVGHVSSLRVPREGNNSLTARLTNTSNRGTIIDNIRRDGGVYLQLRKGNERGVTSNQLFVPLSLPKANRIHIKNYNLLSGEISGTGRFQRSVISNLSFEGLQVGQLYKIVIEAFWLSTTDNSQRNCSIRIDYFNSSGNDVNQDSNWSRLTKPVSLGAQLGGGSAADSLPIYGSEYFRFRIPPRGETAGPADIADYNTTRRAVRFVAETRFTVRVWCQVRVKEVNDAVVENFLT